jgi:hypothetical protein
VFLIFILIVQVPEKTCVAATTERSSPGQVALIVRRGMLFVPAPFSILSHSYPETAAPSSKNVKFSDHRRFGDLAHRLHYWDLDRKRYTTTDLPRTASRVIDAGAQV